MLHPFYYDCRRAVLTALFFTAGFAMALAQTSSSDETISSPRKHPHYYYVIPESVRIGEYFAYMDSLCAMLNRVLPYNITEHLLVRANPFVLENLQNTDYYRMKAAGGVAVYDQSRLLALRAGDTLQIPDKEEAAWMLALQSRTFLDINIPEFKLRIVENGDTLFTFPVRVGQNRARFLAAVGRDIDLRTKTGRGEIAVLHRDIVHIDPVTADTFTHTKRDDGITTRLPLIPWLEPRINGQLHGQWIHPTTNPRTLGRAYSNGCIGTREADAWVIYYYAPVGTRVHVRYDLETWHEDGSATLLPDIYEIERDLLPPSGEEYLGER